MEAEIEKLIVTMTKEDQEEDKDNGKLISELGHSDNCTTILNLSASESRDITSAQKIYQNNS
ncbi:hypothetical protein YC2023_006946 [Brassica napus]